MDIHHKYEDSLRLTIDPNVTMIHDYESGENSYVSNSQIGSKNFFRVPFYVGAGSSGMTGSTGPCGSYGYSHYIGPTLTQNPYDDEFLTNQDLPKIFTLKVSFALKEVQMDDKVFQEVLKLVSKFPGAHITSEGPIKKQACDQTRPKLEHQCEIDEITQFNAKGVEKYERLIAELTEIGSLVRGFFNAKQIPKEYYESYDFYCYSGAFIKISCHRKTEAHDILVSMGWVMKSLTPHYINILKHKKYNQRLIAEDAKKALKQ